MARTVLEIQAAIIAAKEADGTLSGLTSTSRVAIWRLWTYIVALAVYTLELRYDTLKVDVAADLAIKRPHTPKWYAEKAKAFQYGVTLPDDSDVYEIVPPEDEAVLIIAQAAVVEVDLPGTRYLRIKVAKESGGDLAIVPPGELTPFTTYMNRIKDAGVRLQITSGDADDLQSMLQIHYDPLILDADGKRLDGTDDEPVKTAYKAFLKRLGFNGLFVRNFMIAAIQAVEGVEICTAFTTKANYAATPYVNIITEYLPEAGYIRLNEAYFDAHVSYVPHEPI